MSSIKPHKQLTMNNSGISMERFSTMEVYFKALEKCDDILHDLNNERACLLEIQRGSIDVKIRDWKNFKNYLQSFHVEYIDKFYLNLMSIDKSTCHPDWQKKFKYTKKFGVYMECTGYGVKSLINDRLFDFYNKEVRDYFMRICSKILNIISENDCSKWDDVNASIT